MILPDSKVSRAHRLNMAIAGMEALDLARGEYRATADRNLRGAWLDEALVYNEACKWLDTPTMAVMERRSGTYAIQREPVLALVLGPKPQTDLSLAHAFAHLMRMFGAFPGRAPVRGYVDDGVTMTIMTMALAAHDTARAGQFWQFAEALGLKGTLVPGFTPQDWT